MRPGPIRNGGLRSLAAQLRREERAGRSLAPPPRVFAIIVAAMLMLPPAAGIGTATEGVSRIAFGACLRQRDPQPVWSAILAARPDQFVFMGDNVYADTDDPDQMRAEYARLDAQSGFRALRERATLRAIWDDHDYGRNDGGAAFAFKDGSKSVFLDLFGFPDTAPERGRPGLYQAYVDGPPGKRVQIILLDTRYFRSPLKLALPNLDCPRMHPVPNDSPDATILGEAQWRWLERTLREPAELRLIVSSIQVIPEEHCFEKWANFPAERDRLFRLLAETQARGVLLLSGDRHLAEMSRINPDCPLARLRPMNDRGSRSVGPEAGEPGAFAAGHG